jgi:hypothetical protein
MGCGQGGGWRRHPPSPCRAAAPTAHRRCCRVIREETKLYRRLASPTLTRCASIQTTRMSLTISPSCCPGGATRIRPQFAPYERTHPSSQRSECHHHRQSAVPFSVVALKWSTPQAAASTVIRVAPAGILQRGSSGRQRMNLRRAMGTLSRVGEWSIMNQRTAADWLVCDVVCFPHVPSAVCRLLP